MDGINNVVIPLSILAGALATIFGLFSVIIRGVKWFLALPQEVKNHFYRPRYILTPTLEEIAVYGAKEPCSYIRMTDAELIEERIGWIRSQHRRHRRDVDLRLRILLLCYISIYAFFIFRLTGIALFEGAGLASAPRFPVFLLLVFNVVVAAAALFSIGQKGFIAFAKRFWN